MWEEENCRWQCFNKRTIQKSISSLGNRIQRFSSELCGVQSATNDQKRVEIEQLIGLVYSKLNEELEHSKEKYNEEDLKLVLECSEYRYVERFLERQKYNVDETIKMIKETLKWRKEEGLSSLTEQSFPRICYQSGFQYIYEYDRDDNVVFHVRLKLYQKFHNSFVHLMEKFFCFLTFRADQMGAKLNTGWIMVADMTDVSIKQWDLQHFLWLIKIFTNYCPSGLRKVIIFNITWLLKPLLNTAIAVMPHYVKSILLVVQRDELYQHISPENLPKYLGGSNERDHREAPNESLPNVHDYMASTYDISFNEVSKVLKKYETLIKEDASKSK